MSAPKAKVKAKLKAPKGEYLDPYTGKTNTSFGDCFGIDQRDIPKQFPKLVFVLPVDPYYRAVGLPHTSSV